MNARTSLLFAAVALVSSAHGALVDRGGGMIYDATLGVTWLQDANYASRLTTIEVAEIVNKVNASNPSWLGAHTMAASDFLVANGSYSGRMTWWGAMAWAEEFSYGGYSDWRLPITVQPDSSCSQQSSYPSGAISYGANCSGSEMGHLFYIELDGTYTGSSTVLIDPHPFTNMREVYWSNTVYSYDPDGSWIFNFAGGNQDPYNKVSDMFALAVRDGDVAVVPEPSSYLLALTALGVLAIASRRMRRQRR